MPFEKHHSRTLHAAFLLPALVVLVLMLAVAGPLQAQVRTFTELYSFTDNRLDGLYPTASLTLDPRGNVYGVTTNGGGGDCSQGCGTVFEVNTSDVESIVYPFAGEGTDGTGADGWLPDGSLLRDGAGNLYGTTFGGGTFSTGCFNHDGCGTVYKRSIPPAEKKFSTISQAARMEPIPRLA